MKKIKLTLLIILGAALALLVLQNMQPWQVSFLWISGELPGIVLLLLTASAGFVAGVIAAILMKRSEAKQSNRPPRNTS